MCVAHSTLRRQQAIQWKIGQGAENIAPNRSGSIWQEAESKPADKGRSTEQRTKRRAANWAWERDWNGTKGGYRDNMWCTC